MTADSYEIRDPIHGLQNSHKRKIDLDQHYELFKGLRRIPPSIWRWRFWCILEPCTPVSITQSV